MESTQAGRKPKPSYEVEPERYYREFLRRDDAQHLRAFVTDLGVRLSVPSAILAVGSSVFPNSHWEYRGDLNRKNSDLGALESYQDIDLLIVPEEVAKLTQLETAVQKALAQMGYPVQTHGTTIMGVIYVDAFTGNYKEGLRKRISPFCRVGYGIHSVSTDLRNSTKLDLILGRDDLLEQTAAQKIAKEREEGYAFSLLYKR